MSREIFELPANLTENTRDAWRAAVEKSLNGRSLESALASTTYDGITIKPLYDQTDLEGSAAAPILKNRNGAESARPWEMLQLIDIPGAKAANEQIKKDIAGGAGGLYLSISTDIPYASSTLTLREQADMAALFDGVDLKGKALYLSNGYEGLLCAANLMNHFEAEGNPPEGGSFGFDPLSLFAAMGAFPDPVDEAISNWTDAAHAITASDINMNCFMASGQTWQQAGASEAMELGFTLASALYYVRMLEASGMSLDESFKAVDFSLIVTGDIFLSTAKLRAMRLLWGRICEEAKVTPSARLLAKMSYRDLAMRDPETNMLRATAATVAAGLGNADALVLLPYSSAHGLAAPKARRLALNTQIIAQEESHIGTIEDPASGSWYVESLTSELAAKAWAYFQQVEQGGGMPAMLRKGKIKALIEPVSAARDNDVSTGKKVITGLNSFPNINEQPPELAAEDKAGSHTAYELPDPADEGAITLKLAGNGERFADLKQNLANGESYFALLEALEGPQSLITMLGDVNSRLATNIESLRSVSDYIKVETGARPSVFIANLGRPSDFTARATWARSYFETGGIEALSNDGFADRKALIESFKSSGAKIACLCSTDDVYMEEAVETAQQLKAAGAHGVYMVARPNLLKSLPPEARNELHALLYVGTDMVLTLMEAYYLIGLEDESLQV